VSGIQQASATLVESGMSDMETGGNKWKANLDEMNGKEVET
jgi:hypothetical protein